MVTLEQRLKVAAAGSDQAQDIADELERAQQDVELFRSQLSTDFERTKALVDAYMNEVRAKEENAAMKLTETRGQIATLASSIYQDRDELTRRMLLPTVQLNGEDTVGSGTIVFSGPNRKNGGKVETYVLTSYHVVRNILADTPKARRTGFDVTVYLPDENLVVKGNMIVNDPKIDAALVKLETDRVLPNVANVLPREETDQVHVWDPVCAVGCPLGNDPVPSKGEVSSLSNNLNGANYWMVNAPTYFGNSGGAAPPAKPPEEKPKPKPKPKPKAEEEKPAPAETPTPAPAEPPTPTPAAPPADKPTVDDEPPPTEAAVPADPPAEPVAAEDAPPDAPPSAPESPEPGAAATDEAAAAAADGAEEPPPA